MTDKKEPWMKFYPSDWRGDPRLRMCSIGARGLWMEMMCIMHEANPYGHLVVGDVPVTNRQLASLAGISQPDCLKFMAELESAGVYSRQAESKIIFSRRMVRDRERAEAGRAHVAKKWGTSPGAEPTTRTQRLSAARRKGKHTAEEWSALLEVCAFKCVKCGGNENGLGVCKDHIVPIYQGGSDSIENLQPLCARCNQGKGPDRTDHRPPDWKRRLGERLGQTQKPPTSESRSQNDDGDDDDAGATPPPNLPSMELTEKLLVIAGHDLRFWPPGWCGAPMRVQVWLSAGWSPEIIVATARAVMGRKRDGPPTSVKYFETAIAAEVAALTAPVPTGEILNVQTSSEQPSLRLLRSVPSRGGGYAQLRAALRARQPSGSG